MDSLIHRFSSKRWPMMMQAERRATKMFMETTEAWSEVSLWNIAPTAMEEDIKVKKGEERVCHIRSEMEKKNAEA